MNFLSVVIVFPWRSLYTRTCEPPEARMHAEHTHTHINTHTNTHTPTHTPTHPHTHTHTNTHTHTRTLVMSLYNKRDDFPFAIHNYPHLDTWPAMRVISLGIRTVPVLSAAKKLAAPRPTPTAPVAKCGLIRQDEAH